MRVTLIGGMDRLEPHYQATARKAGFDLRVFKRAETGFGKKLGQCEAVVLFTGNISHQARNVAIAVARARAIPVYQYHSCGVCTLRKCLDCLNQTKLVHN
jgi:hypothetical protein